MSMPALKGIHHVAVIATDYVVSKKFYSEILGMRVVAENYRADRDSWKCDLEMASGEQVELFTMPGAPARVNNPEALGLRHLAFRTNNVEEYKEYLESHGIFVEDIRVDEYTGKKFTFFKDPDLLPLELYESP